MQTVAYTINIINAQNSNVLIGNSGSICIGGSVDEFTAEALRIMAALNVRGKVAALSYLYALEDGRKLPFYKEASA